MKLSAVARCLTPLVSNRCDAVIAIRPALAALGFVFTFQRPGEAPVPLTGSSNPISTSP